MFTIMFIGVMVKAALLCGLLYAVAKHEADYSFSKVAMVTAGLALGSMCIDGIVAPQLGIWTAIVHVAFICFMIMTFCWISFAKSLIVVGIYCAIHFAMAFGGALLAGYLIKETQGTGMMMMGASESEFNELQQEIMNQFENLEQQTELELEAAARRASAPPPETTAKKAAPRKATATGPRGSLPAVVEKASADDMKWLDARRSVRVSGIIGAAGSRMATINDELKEVGDIVAVGHGGQVYRWEVTGITADNVNLKPLNRSAAR